jgi:hypothetical protein
LAQPGIKFDQSVILRQTVPDCVSEILHSRSTFIQPDSGCHRCRMHGQISNLRRAGTCCIATAQMMETGNSPTQIQGKYCCSALGLAEMMGEALSMEGNQDKKKRG